jgi:organic hydroperoxide reductase OsmC/OhrA
MAQEHFYNMSVIWKRDRFGVMSSKELNDTIDVATPPEFPKGIPGIWSPEHLLIAAVNSCLMTTFLAVAENMKLPFTAFTSNASGKLEIVDGKYIVSEITLSPKITISTVEDQEKTLRVLQKSEAACIISNSIKSRIIFEPTVIIADMAV